MSTLHLILTVVVALRVAELALSARNVRRLLARGGREVGAGHYPLLLALHAAWLVALALRGAGEPSAAYLLGVFGLLQGLRVWVIASLGAYWTTRIVTLPDAPLVRHGPYRWLRHPNYLVVAAEIAVLPLAFGAWGVALVFSLMNAALLAHRIAIEDRALAARRADDGTGS